MTTCIKCRILGLTKKKLQDLDHEYNGFQWWMIFGVDKEILSQHKRAKGYNYKIDKIKYKDYPMIIPKKQVAYRYNNNSLAKDWVKISVRKRKGVGSYQSNLIRNYLICVIFAIHCLSKIKKDIMS